MCASDQGLQKVSWSHDFIDYLFENLHVLTMVNNSDVHLEKGIQILISPVWPGDIQITMLVTGNNIYFDVLLVIVLYCSHGEFQRWSGK